MTTKQLAILLAILLAISILLNIDCYFGKDKPEEITWSADSVAQAMLKVTQLSLCSVDSNGTITCSKDSVGMRGGSIEIEKLLPMLTNPEINCISYAFMPEAGRDPSGSGTLKLVFHGNHYDEVDGHYTIKYVSGPSYVSDMLCPINCPQGD